MTKKSPQITNISGVAGLRALDFVFLALIIIGALASMASYFQINIKSFWIDFLYILIFGGLAFAISRFVWLKNSLAFSLILICMLAISYGAKNGGLFGTGAGAIFWPSMASFFLRPRPLISMASSILVFMAITFFGLISGNAPSFDNPIFPSLLSLGVNAVLLSILNNYGFLAFGNLSKIQEKEVAAAQTRAQIADNKSKERATFIAQMSHEIRNPLNAIIGFGDLLRSEPYGPLHPQYKEFAELILQGGHHLNDLVGDILDMSKIEAGRYSLNPEVFDLVQIGRETIALNQSNAASKSIELNLIGANTLHMNADKRAMRQIMLNLLSNAIKYSDENTKVTMRIFGNNDNAWLEVEDNGRGMSADEIKNIGEPYMEAKSNDGKTRSTGLGLSLVKKLTEMQNGTFDVSSTIGKGSTFSLCFPIH